MPTIDLLSSGATKGLVSAVQARFLAQTVFGITGSFNAVGMMKDQLLAGAACDVVILTESLIRQLGADGHVVVGSEQPLGLVKTGIAVKEGAASPPLANADQLRSALESATAIYFPDPVKATAGIHFMKVLRELGIDTTLAGRLRPCANGAAAMQALSQAKEPGAMGCTQISEIIIATGVRLAASLPKAFELATIYSAAVSTRAAHPEAGAALINLLTSQEAAGLRSAGGFEPVTS